MKLEFSMTYLLVKLDPKVYTKYIHKVNVKLVMFFKLEKALCGMIQVAMLLCKDLTQKLMVYFKLTHMNGVLSTNQLMANSELFRGM